MKVDAGAQAQDKANGMRHNIGNFIARAEVDDVSKFLILWGGHRLLRRSNLQSTFLRSGNARGLACLLIRFNSGGQNSLPKVHRVAMRRKEVQTAFRSHMHAIAMIYTH